MNSIDPETLKIAQKIMLEILIEVDRVCKKHHIDYWLDSGTLLGAVRDGEFIPWDDDLDIAMCMEDYEKFCKVAPKELTEEVSLQVVENDPTFPYHHAKLRSSKGKIVEKHEAGKPITYNQGIFIDIFPTIMIKDKLLSKILHRVGVYVVKLFSYKYLNIPLVEKRLIAVVDSLNQGKNKSGKMVYSARMPYPLFGINAEDMFPLSKISFCDKEFPAPKNPEVYLVSLYGKSYTQLPKEEDRKTHAHSIEIFDV